MEKLMEVLLAGCKRQVLIHNIDGLYVVSVYKFDLKNMAALYDLSKTWLLVRREDMSLEKALMECVIKLVDDGAAVS
jgi:hypothetical protein